MARTQIATDDFNRADGPLGAPNWAQLNAGFCRVDIASNQIVGSHAQADPHGAARWIGSGTFTADQYSKVEIAGLTAASASHGIGVMCRASADTGAGRDWYELYVLASTGGSPWTTQLAKFVNGTITVLHSATVAWVVGDTIELEVEGTTIRGMRNGTALGGSFTQTDSDLSTGQPGVVGASGSASAIGDNWEAGNITAAGSNLLLKLMQQNQFRGGTL